MKYVLPRIQVFIYILILYIKKIALLPTKHLRVHMNSFKHVRAFADQIGIWKCWILRRGENRSTRRKTSLSKGENQQQTQPTYGINAGI